MHANDSGDGRPLSLAAVKRPQQCLNLLPLPQGHWAFRLILLIIGRKRDSLATIALASGRF
jgi:hypothetical protein